MWAHPGKQLLFMGGELAQEREWDHDRSLDWHLLGRPRPRRRASAWSATSTTPTGRGRRCGRSTSTRPGSPGWRPTTPTSNVAAFLRIGADGEVLACVANLSPVPRYDYRIGLPVAGAWHEVLNTDAAGYGGSGVGNLGAVVADGPPAHGQPTSARFTLPPLAVVWFEPSGS